MDNKFRFKNTHRRGRALRSRCLRVAVTVLFGASALSLGNVVPAYATGLTTACALFLDPNPSNFGQNVNIALFVRVSTFPGPFSAVTFFDGGVPLHLPVALTPDGFGSVDHSTVSIDTSSLSPGTHVITAIFYPSRRVAMPPRDPIIRGSSGQVGAVDDRIDVVGEPDGVRAEHHVHRDCHEARRRHTDGHCAVQHRRVPLRRGARRERQRRRHYEHRGAVRRRSQRDSIVHQ